MSSIKIVSPDEIAKRPGAIPPLLFSNLTNLYTRRAERLRALAEGHAFGDYLLFVASLVDAQANTLKRHPFTGDLTQTLADAAEKGETPLSVHHFKRDAHWHTLLDSIITELKPSASEHIAAVLNAIDALSADEREAMADALFKGDYASVGSDKAIFIWAALSLYWSQMAHSLPGKAKADYGENRQFCPVCESAPVGSMIHIGTEQGLRYLHCGLCETDWHMVRIKCSNCEKGDKLNYWSLDTEQASVKAESCGSCHSYLKVFYQDKDPRVDVIADDLATIVLDAKMEAENFARSAINPFLFPEK